MTHQMVVCIPTRGRPDAQITWAQLPWEWKGRTYFVCDADRRLEVQSLAKRGAVLVYPGGPGIGPKRQWTLEHAPSPYVCLLDDDLHFAARRDGRLLKATGDEIAAGLSRLESWLRDLHLVAVGLSPRAGNNREEGPYAENTRLCNAYAFDRDVALSTGARFDRLWGSMEDFDFTLQLLRAGYPNRVDYLLAVGQDDPNAVGGCTEYLTPAVQKDAALKLAELHPGLVTVKDKVTKGGWHGFTERTDVEVAWKKALRTRHQTSLL